MLRKVLLTCCVLGLGFGFVGCKQEGKPGDKPAAKQGDTKKTPAPPPTSNPRNS